MKRLYMKQRALKNKSQKIRLSAREQNMLRIQKKCIATTFTSFKSKPRLSWHVPYANPSHGEEVTCEKMYRLYTFA